MLSRETANTNFWFFGLSRIKLEPTIYRIRGEHANHYITVAVKIPMISIGKKRETFFVIDTYWQHWHNLLALRNLYLRNEKKIQVKWDAIQNCDNDNTDFYSQTCIQLSPLRQRKIDTLRQLTSLFKICQSRLSVPVHNDLDISVNRMKSIEKYDGWRLICNAASFKKIFYS